MRDLLIASGVPGERILLEETGDDTLSSVRAIRRLLRTRADISTVYAATSLYHLPRCLLLLRLVGLRARACPAPAHPASAWLWKRWYWWLREILAIPYDAILLLWLRLTDRL